MLTGKPIGFSVTHNLTCPAHLLCDDFLLDSAGYDARPWPGLHFRQRHPARRSNHYNVFATLGLALGTPKCNEIPTTSPEFIGYRIYTSINKLELTEKRVANIRKALSELSTAKMLSRRRLAQIAGYLASGGAAVHFHTLWARTFITPLIPHILDQGYDPDVDKWYTILEDIDWDGEVTVDDEIREVAQFVALWWDDIHGKPMHPPMADYNFEADASGRRRFQLGGCWYRLGRRIEATLWGPRSVPEHLSHERIHVWEAAALRLLVMESGLSHVWVVLKTDNSANMFAVLRGSRSPALHSESLSLAMHCVRNHIRVLRTAYINTHHNVIADFISRLAINSWHSASIQPGAVAWLCREWDGVPCFDCMADPTNVLQHPYNGRRLPFCGWLPWAGMARRDFFDQNFADVNGILWLFPPPHLAQAAATHAVSHIQPHIWMLAPLYPVRRWYEILKARGDILATRHLCGDAIVGPSTHTYGDWIAVWWKR
jgi:hypothetical protein